MSDEAPFPGRTCPHCGWFADGTAGYGHDRHPSDGDFNLCARCTGLSVIEGGRLRRPTPAEAQEAELDPAISEARTVLLLRQALGPREL